MRKDVVLYISPSDSEFVKKDIVFLNNHFKVIHYSKDWGDKKKVIYLFLKQLIFLLLPETIPLSANCAKN